MAIPGNWRTRSSELPRSRDVLSISARGNEYPLFQIADKSTKSVAAVLVHILQLFIEFYLMQLVTTPPAYYHF